MALSKCACEWDGPLSAPRMRKPCVAHVEWMQKERIRARKAAVIAEREACAKLADVGMLVPPDGGSPTQDEIDVAKRIAAAIRART